MTLEDLNEWLATNQLLVFSVIVPIVSGLIALASSWFAVKRALQSEKQRREHEAVTQISEFRQRWINELRDRIAEFGGITSVHTRDHDIDKAVVALTFKIELLMNPNDPDFEQLRAALKYRADAQALGCTGTLDSKHDNLLEISQRILKREWNRLKDELRDPTKFASAP